MDSIPVSHLPPVKPGLHSHLYLLTSSVQFPWTHWHSLMSSVKKRKTLLILYFFHHILYQNGLIYIFLICCRLFGCDLWGEKVSCIGFILDGSIKYTKRNIINKIYTPVSQLIPVKPGWHSHVYMLKWSVQFPWMHGADWHSLMSAKRI